MKTAAEIREFLLARLRLCLFRPGLCGGELGILNLFEYLTFIDERDEEWQEYRAELHRTKAFNSRGLTGGFEYRHGNRKDVSYDNLVASVYAQIAFEMGYLVPLREGEKYGIARLLDPDKYDSMRQITLELCNVSDPEDGDFAPEDILQRFGSCSIRWGTNDKYPCTLTYFFEGDFDVFIHFDFWARWYKDESGARVPGKYGPKPLLGNVRLPAETFPEQFVFTSFGKSLRESGE